MSRVGLSRPAPMDEKKNPLRNEQCRDGHPGPGEPVQDPGGDEEGRPARVGVRRHEDVARFEVSPGHVREKARAALDRSCRDRDADQGIGEHVVAAIRPRQRLAVRGQNPRRRERVVGSEGIFARLDERRVRPVPARDVVQLREGEEEGILRLGHKPCAREPFGLRQQRRAPLPLTRATCVASTS